MAEKKTEKVEEVKTTKPTSKPKIVEEKFTKVTPKISGQRFIGGTWYQLKKDKEIEVTQEAKRVLLEARAIYI
jgi:hypothetical protein